MKSVTIWTAVFAWLTFQSATAQIKNATTETVKIYGNCGMCERTIEKAGTTAAIAQVDWNKDTKLATITYDPSKTNRDEILKRIALSGYDSDHYLAPDEAYAKLPECCQYDRSRKSDMAMAMSNDNATADHHMQHKDAQEKSSQLKPVYDHYFALKDALVQSDAALASNRANALLQSLQQTDMKQLNTREHTVWMQVMNALRTDSEQMAKTKDLELQRKHFISLSKNMHELVKASHPEMPVYYQHCPMANGGKGAHWLSLESTVKNPYYGASMLSCGKTVEVIE